MPLPDTYEHQHTPSKLAALQGLRKLLDYLEPLGQKGALAGGDSESGGTASAAEVRLSACHAVNDVLRERTLHHCAAACNISGTQDPFHTSISCKALQLNMQGLLSNG